MRPTKTLLNTITERAKASFVELSKENLKEEWPKWVAHWFETAEAFYAELVTEGLTETAAKVREQIDWQRTQNWKLSDE